MPTRILVATAALLLSGAAMAGPLAVTEQGGSPAIEGNGSSSTTVSIGGGAASLTVESTGSVGIYTHSGTMEGQGAIGVPQLGIGLGGGSSNRAENQSSGTAAAGTAKAGAANQHGSAGSGTADCATESSSSATSEALALVADQNRVDVVPACDSESSLASELLAAIERNPALTGALAAWGFTPADVVAAQSPAEGSAILLVRARQ